ELSREIGMRQATFPRDVVTLEQLDMQRAASGRVLVADAVNRALEKRPNELAPKEVFCVRRNGRVPRELVFGRFEVEWNNRRRPPALGSPSGLLPVHDESIGAQTDERPEARLVGLESLEPGLLVRVGEERLRDILGVFVG